MKHPERIEDYLQHIIEAIDHITGYVQEIDSAASLESDHKTQAAVIRNIEIIEMALCATPRRFSHAHAIKTIRPLPNVSRLGFGAGLGRQLIKALRRHEQLK